MNISKLGWVNLRMAEKVATLVAFVVSVCMSYQAVAQGFGVISIQAIGPLALFAFVAQSTFLVGVIRLRSLTMNTLFVALMAEARDAKNRLGEELDPKSVALVAEFLGDKK